MPDKNENQPISPLIIAGINPRSELTWEQSAAIIQSAIDRKATVLVYAQRMYLQDGDDTAVFVSIIEQVDDHLQAYTVTIPLRDLATNTGPVAAALLAYLNAAPILSGLGAGKTSRPSRWKAALRTVGHILLGIALWHLLVWSVAGQIQLPVR